MHVTQVRGLIEAKPDVHVQEVVERLALPGS